MYNFLSFEMRVAGFGTVTVTIDSICNCECEEDPVSIVGGMLLFFILAR